MSVQKLDRNIFQRLPGISATKKPVGTSTFNYDGSLIEGPAKGPLRVFKVEHAGDVLTITV